MFSERRQAARERRLKTPLKPSEAIALDRYERNVDRRRVIRYGLNTLRLVEWVSWGVVRNVGKVAIWPVEQLVRAGVKKVKPWVIDVPRTAWQRATGRSSFPADLGRDERGMPMFARHRAEVKQAKEAAKPPRTIGRFARAMATIASERTVASLTFRHGRRTEFERRSLLPPR